MRIDNTLINMKEGKSKDPPTQPKTSYHFSNPPSFPISPNISIKGISNQFLS